MSTISNLEQRRAAYAYSCAAEGKDNEKRKDYKSYVHRMPMLIKTNGLGAAIAFAFANGCSGGSINPDAPWGLLYLQISNWLNEKALFELNTNELAKKLTEINSSEYKAATIEVLALLNWMKRFSDALIDGE